VLPYVRELSRSNQRDAGNHARGNRRPADSTSSDDMVIVRVEAVGFVQLQVSLAQLPPQFGR
jgi:hypothetical protein